MRRLTLIIGAFGFLGKNITNCLIDSNCEVESLDFNNKATYNFDISNGIPEFAKHYKLVVHSAGLAHMVPKTKEQEDRFYEINYQGTINICSALEPNPPKNFIFISTIAVYGRETGTKLAENIPLDGKTPYAKSKIMAEKYLSDWCQNFDVNLVILRLPLVAGNDAKGNLGAMIKGIKKGYYFNIKDSSAKKSIVLADDVAELIPKLIGKNGTYNLSGDKDYTFKEISEIIAKQLGNKKVISTPKWIIKLLSKAGDIITFLPLNSDKYLKMTNDLTVSAENAKKELGWNPRSLENYKI